MKNVIIYTRVSTEEQKTNFSLRAQKGRLENYCSRNGYRIVGHYEDNCSAKTFDRPEFQNMLKYIQNNKNKVDEVLFLKWDRFSRNIIQAYNMIDKLAKLNVSVNAIEQKVDTNVPENKVFLALYLATPEVENERRGLNTRTGMIKAKEEGKWVAGAPYGYKHSGSQKGMLVKNEKAPLVLEAFSLLSKGIYSREEVRAILKKKGMTLSRSAFWNMLNNIMYCGYIKVPAYTGKPEDLVKGIHEPIIPVELFNKVQQILKSKGNQKSKPKTIKEGLPLRGYLICPECGRNLTGSTSNGNGGKYSYYHCQKGCAARFRSEHLNNSFCNWLSDISIKPEIRDLYIEVMRDIFKTKEKDKSSELDELKKKISKKEDNLNKAVEKYLDQDLDKTEFELYKKKTKEQLNSLTLRVHELERMPDSFDIYLSYGFFLLNNMAEYYQGVNIDGKRKFLGSIFPNKLKISGNSYRTNGDNVLIDLICNTGKPFPKLKNEKASKNADLFRMVALPGIEPRSKV